VREGAILIYTRQGRKKAIFQARFKVPGLNGYVVRSLKTNDLSAAVIEAENLFHELRIAQKQGIDVKKGSNLTFSGLWKIFFEAHQIGLSTHRMKLFNSNFKNYFIPFFGNYRVAELSNSIASKYWDFRINFYNPERRASLQNTAPIPRNAARSPSQKTLDMEAGMLRQIFRWGRTMGYVNREPWIKAPKVRHETGVVRRPAFTRDEWTRVYTYMRKWVQEPMQSVSIAHGGNLHRKGPHALHRFQRELLRNYVLFMANSGLRPGEARELKWQDVRYREEDGLKVVILKVAPHTKTGARTVVCRHGADLYLERVKQNSSHTLPNDYIFCDHDGEPVETINKTFQKV
jgi:integrase